MHFALKFSLIEMCYVIFITFSESVLEGDAELELLVDAADGNKN